MSKIYRLTAEVSEVGSEQRVWLTKDYREHVRQRRAAKALGLDADSDSLDAKEELFNVHFYHNEDRYIDARTESETRALLRQEMGRKANWTEILARFNHFIEQMSPCIDYDDYVEVTRRGN